MEFMMKRRSAIGAIGAGTLLAGWPTVSSAAPVRKVVVIGGGMAGATVAKYLRLWSGKTVEVTVVEASKTYVSNIMSNLVITGQYTPSILNYTWANLAKNHGVKVVNGTVTGVVPGGMGSWTVQLTTVTGAQTSLSCDRVVVAPGISFDPVPNGVGGTAPVLHAWQAGPQTTQLGSYLASMPPTGTFVMTIPAAPYRCPPGPYERACVIADYLKRNKPSAHIVVLDENQDIVAEKENFAYAFSSLYGNNLSYLPGRKVTAVSSAAGRPGGVVSVDLVVRNLDGSTTSMGSERWAGDVLNVIPAQRAGTIALNLGLCDADGFAPVDGRSFESLKEGKAGIHVIGDAAKTTLPKAGHVGNQGAKICADAILRASAGLPPYATPTANSACYSPLSNTVASWLTAVYQYQSVGGQWKYVASDQVSGATGATEAQKPSTGNFSKMSTWYKSLMNETFT